MTARHCAVIGIAMLAFAVSSGFGFAAGDGGGNRGLEMETVSLPEGTSVTIVRGRPSVPDSLEKAAPLTVSRAEPWVVGGDRLWIVDPEKNRIRVCYLHRTSYVGKSIIRCLSRY